MEVSTGKNYFQIRDEKLRLRSRSLPKIRFYVLLHQEKTELYPFEENVLGCMYLGKTVTIYHYKHFQTILHVKSSRNPFDIVYVRIFVIKHRESNKEFNSILDICWLTVFKPYNYPFLFCAISERLGCFLLWDWQEVQIVKKPWLSCTEILTLGSIPKQP